MTPTVYYCYMMVNFWSHLILKRFDIRIDMEQIAFLLLK